jgi:hypothetical protein
MKLITYQRKKRKRELILWKRKRVVDEMRK